MATVLSLQGEDESFRPKLSVGYATLHTFRPKRILFAVRGVLLKLKFIDTAAFVDNCRFPREVIEREFPCGNSFHGIRDVYFHHELPYLSNRWNHIFPTNVNQVHVFLVQKWFYEYLHVSVVQTCDVKKRDV